MGARDARGVRAQSGKRGNARVGSLANAHPPVLHTHDRYGNRRDEVEFHPAWHNMMRLAVEHGVHSSPWANPRPGAHVARAAAAMLASECEAGHVCPISMTYSSVPVLRRDAELAREWEPRIHSTVYDPSFQPASEKTGALIGMAMTEKQGGSDVRANTTRAEPIGNGEYILTRPQVVLFGSHVRCVSGAGAGARGAFLLFPAALDARRAQAMRFTCRG